MINARKECSVLLCLQCIGNCLFNWYIGVNNWGWGEFCMAAVLKNIYTSFYIHIIWWYVTFIDIPICISSNTTIENQHKITMRNELSILFGEKYQHSLFVLTIWHTGVWDICVTYVFQTWKKCLMFLDHEWLWNCSSTIFTKWYNKY